MNQRGMRLLVHRGQALLLVVVAVLAGVAVAGAVLERDGVSLLGPLRIDELFAPPRPQLPSEIVIGGAVAPRTDSALGSGSATTPAAPDLSSAASPAPVQPTPTTAVVPGAVYTYPPDSHGRGGDGHGGGE
jgi:hypothetical protein